jgi:TonB family protein
MRVRAQIAFSLAALVFAAPARAHQAPPKDEEGFSGRSQGQLVPAAPQSAPPAQPVSLTPPKLLEDPGAEYPRQAVLDGVRETVTVVVIVDVDAAGKVTAARVETPVGHGFDEAAVEAAKHLRFAPALRGTTPVAARVKHKYELAPPPGRIVGRVSSQDGRPVRARVRVRSASGEVRDVSASETGVFELDGLAAGVWTIEVLAEGFVTQTATEPLGPAEELKATFRLEPAVAASGAPAARAKADEDVEEITVRGTRPPREVTRRTMDQRELTKAPGTNGDALRAIQNLPGIARPPGFAGLLIVRGAAPGDTQIFVDGTPVPIIFHFGGLSSVIPTEMLSRIDFYPGNFSAQYGRAIGGIIDVGLRKPKGDKIHGLAQVDLIDMRLLAEVPLGNGWSVSTAGRRSWIDTWLKPVLERVGTGVSSAPVYYDWQAMVNKDWGKDTSARVTFFGSDDRFELLLKDASASTPGATGNLFSHTGFFRVQGVFTSKIAKSTELRFVAAAGQDLIDFAFSDIFFNLRAYPITARAEVAQRVARGATLNVGIDWLYTPYEIGARVPPPAPPGQPPAGPILAQPPVSLVEDGVFYRPAAYAEMELVPWKGARILPGFRVDYAKDTKSADIGPRLAVRQDVGPAYPRTTIKGGLGIFYQPPQPQQSNPVFGQAGLQSNRAYQYSLGLERELTKNVEISVEGFYKQLDRLVTTGNGNAGEGRIFGVETLLRYKPDKRFFGWIAYTLSRSLRRDTPYEPERVAAFDQTHILTILGSYNLGSGWELGARFRLVSGNPFTPNTYGFYDANAGAYLPLRAYPINAERLPLFHQLDVRIDKTWKFKAWQLSAYLDVVNTYNAANVEAITYNYDFTKRSSVTGLPFLPSFGLRGEF